MDVLNSNDKGILWHLLYCLTIFKLITLVLIVSTYFCRLLQQQVCRAGYKVIEVFLYGDSRKNELYLSRFIPFFEAQVCKCLCVLCKEIAYVRSFGDLSRCLYPIEMPTQIYIGIWQLTLVIVVGVLAIQLYSIVSILLWHRTCKMFPVAYWRLPCFGLLRTSTWKYKRFFKSVHWR